MNTLGVYRLVAEMQIDITFYIVNCLHFSEHLRQRNCCLIMDGFQEFILTCWINVAMRMDDHKFFLVTQVGFKHSHLLIVKQSSVFVLK